MRKIDTESVIAEMVNKTSPSNDQMRSVRIVREELQSYNDSVANENLKLSAIGNWIAGGNTGMSSKYLCAVALGGNPQDISYPHDPSDLNRCASFLRLLTDDEEISDLFDKVKNKSKEWSVIIENWEKILELYTLECVGENWSAPKLYAFMKEIGL